MCRCCSWLYSTKKFGESNIFSWVIPLEWNILISGLGFGGSRSTIDGGLEIAVDLLVQAHEGILRLAVKPRKADVHCLDLVLEHRICLADVDEAAGADDLVDRTLLVGLANHLCPVDKMLDKVVILNTVLLHSLGQNLLLRSLGSVILLVGEVEAIKECLVHDVRSDEATILRTLALGVCSCNNAETIGGNDPLVLLLDVHALALKHGLKAHKFLRTKIDLVKQQHRSTAHGLNHGSILPNGITVHKAKTTKQIVLVSRTDDVHAEALALQLCANLLDHRGLAVARQTSDVDGREVLRLQKRFNVAEMSPRDILLRDGGNDRITITVGHCEYIRLCFEYSVVHGLLIIIIFLLAVNDLKIINLVNSIKPTPDAAAMIHHDPIRRSHHIKHLAGNEKFVAADDCIGSAVGGSTVLQCDKELTLRVGDCAVHAVILEDIRWRVNTIEDQIEKKNFHQCIDFGLGTWYNGGMENQVNKNSKSLLSRLLATENIFVIHDKQATTASFDIMNRVLRLPVFKAMSEELYDMLVGHEVAHALYTPFTKKDLESIKNDGFLSSALEIADGDKNMARRAHGYMNVVEDARIERLIKEKFAGIRRDFFVGYKELNDKDFFGIAKKNISEMPFIDRINLYFKIGSHVQISFSDEEMEFVNMVENTRTFDEVVEVTKKIWNYCKDKNNSDTQQDDLLVNIVSNSNGEDSENNSDSSENGSTDKKNNNRDWSSRAVMPQECLTQQNFDKNFDSLRNEYSNDIYYHHLPKFNNNSIYDYKTLLSDFDHCASGCTSKYDEFSNESKKFIEESNRVVNILAQEFMAKKAAQDHHRNTVHRTGMIDTVRMMNYKVSDDIFLRMKVVKKGKSHGLVFYTDLSGSMSPVLEDTFKQLIQLALFCKRVNIPFEVYGFTTRCPSGLDIDDHSDMYETWFNKSWERDNNAKIFNGIEGVESSDPVCAFSLVNLISSKMNNNEFKLSIRNLFAVSSYYRGRSQYAFTIPSMMHLSSTPLIESIVAAMDMVPKFKQENNLDIVHSIFLTDGEATGVRVENNSYCIKNNINFKINHKYSIESNIINIFREVTGAKAICFFLCDQKTSVPYYMASESGMDNNYSDEVYDMKNKQYIKEGWTVANPKNHLYNEKFIIRANNSVENNDLDDILSTKTSNVGIRNGFIKAMNKNLVSRVMLNRFIELIAKE